MRNPKFLGVYSQRVRGRAKKAGYPAGPFYFVWDIGNSSYAVQELDKAFVPRTKPRLVSASQLQTGYNLEPSLLHAPVSTPDFRQILSDAARPAAGRQAAELNDNTLLELEKARKAKQVENDLRDSFNKALRALNRPRDRKGALAAIEQLANATEGIVPAHKHMFRDFGVSLRKKSLPELALLCAKKTLELAPNDDHAHFNMARILNILNMNDQALAHLRMAIKLDAREPVYHRFRDYIYSSGNTMD